MNFVKAFDLFGTTAQQIPCITGKGAPTNTTEGAVGCLYMDTDTDTIYKCTAIDNGEHVWKSVIPADSVKNTATGQMLALTDAVNAPISNIKIFGQTKQYTGESKSKIPYPYVDTTKTVEGLTFTDNGDGSLAVKGNSPSNAVKFILTETNIFEDGKTYYLPSNEELGVWNDQAPLHIKCSYNDANGQEQIVGGYEGATIAWSSAYTFNSVYLEPINSAPYDGVVYPIIVEGTSYDGNWMPGSGERPMPNMDLPVPFEDTNDSVTVVIPKKSVFNNDTSLLKVIDALTTADGLHFMGYEVKIPAGSYTVSTEDLTPEEHKNLVITVFNKNGQYSKDLTLISGGHTVAPVTFTISEGDYLYVQESTPIEVIGGAEKIINEFKNVNIQIEPGYKATPFEPYDAQSFTITGDFKGMRHLDNCNYYDLAKGVKVQKVDEIVFDGESEFDGVQGVWSAAGPGDGTFTIVQWQSDPEHKISKLLSANDNVAPMCTHFVNQDGSLEWDYMQMEAGQYPNVYFYTAGNWTVDTFKQRLKELYDAGTPMKLRYVLAEPIETPLTEAEIALLKGLKTFGEGTLVYNTDGALLEVEYQADTKKYIDNKIEELTAALITE